MKKALKLALLTSVQPGKEHEPSSLVYTGLKLVAATPPMAEMAQPKNHGVQRPESKVAAASKLGRVESVQPEMKQPPPLKLAPGW